MLRIEKSKVLRIIVSTVMFLSVELATCAQEGIQWANISGWDAVVAKAKKEKKYIFVDCYATWCGPCKKMDKETFDSKEVGDFFKDKFIAVKIQMDSTGKDNKITRGWYTDAVRMKKKYLISAFPTSLFFNPRGELVEKQVGLYGKDAFISLAQGSLKPGKKYDDPFKEFYSLKDKYDKGIKQYSHYPYMIKVASQTGQEELGNKLVNELYRHLLSSTESELLNKEYIEFIVEYASVKDKNADNNLGWIFFRDGRKVDSLMERKNYSRAALNEMIRRGYVDEFQTKIINPKLNKNETLTEEEWKDLFARISSKFDSSIAEQNTLWAKYVYNYNKQDQSSAVAILYKLVERYGLEAISIEPSNTGMFINMIAWDYGVLKSDNRNDNLLLTKLMKKYLESERSYFKQCLHNHTDTYARLLYKVGEKEEAIEVEQKALDLYLKCGEGKLKDDTYNNYSSALKKMQKGEELISQ